MLFAPRNPKRSSGCAPGAMMASTDLDGEAVRWGLAPAPPMASWTECCEACHAHKQKGGKKPCTHWVFCPEPTCWSPDVWNHTQGECWLKWHDNTQQAPKVNAKGAYTAGYRAEHTTAPGAVQWVSGINEEASK